MKNLALKIIAYFFSIIIFVFFDISSSLASQLSSSLKANPHNQVQNIFINDKKDGQIELNFELKQSTKCRIFYLKNPDRLVVDFDKTFLNYKTENFSYPLFLSIRHSFENQRLRVVFDLKNVVTIKNSSIKKIKNKYFLLVNLVDGQSSVANSQIEGTEPIKLAPIKYSVKKIKPLPIIIIDAGHGGKDPGTIAKDNLIQEKYITLNYAQELKNQLIDTKKFRVFLTRDDDFFIPLGARVQMARKINADLFISLHADSSPKDKTSGLSIYTLSEQSSDKQADLLAQKENKADIIYGANFADANGDVLKTLINLSQRNSMNESAKFAEMVIASMKKIGVETLQKTHRFAGFKVLTAPDVPSILIELGYLSNSVESKKLVNQEYRGKVAESLVIAIEKYFQRNE